MIEFKKYKVVIEKKGITKKEIFKTHTYREAKEFFNSLEVENNISQISLYENRTKMITKNQST